MSTEKKRVWVRVLRAISKNWRHHLDMVTGSRWEFPWSVGKKKDAYVARWPQPGIGENFLTECQELWFTGSKGGFWYVPSPGIFFSLRQDTGWFSAAARVDWMAFSEPTGLMLLSARFQGPCQLPTPSSEAVAFSPQKGTISLSLSVSPSDQPFSAHCGFSALQHLGTFLLRQGPPGNNVTSVCWQ